MRSLSLRRSLLALALAVTSLSIAACNTMEGAGKDLQKGGAALEDSAQEHKNY
jgi:entericidin B